MAKGQMRSNKEKKKPKAESLRQEELAERPIDGEALHLTLAGRVASPERGVGQARTQSQRYSAAIILPAAE